MTVSDLLRAAQTVAEGAVRPLARFSDAMREPQVLGEVGHRPWPLPREPWFMGQVWLDLLFAHWPLPPAALAAVVPPGLSLDTYEGRAWIGVTPFRVVGLRLRGMAPVPVLSAFEEINVRTYVTVEGRPGIYFLSLDAASLPAVFAARRAYRLPYFHSRIAMDEDDGRFAYRSRRTAPDGPPASFAAEYQPRGPLLPVVAGSLERWLTERYCLYTLDERRRVHRGEIHHPPWPLHSAAADIAENTMGADFGLALNGEPLLHFAPRQDVAIWPIHPLGHEALR
jgi:uncharacterized protein YqjF (DUF2071 family)